MRKSHDHRPMLFYPFPTTLLFGMIFGWLACWGGVIFELLANWHYSFYELPVVKMFAEVGLSIFGILLLQGVLVIVANWGKFQLMIDDAGFHGVMGITFIPWSEIASLENRFVRYTLLGQRVSFFTVRVKSLQPLLQREHGYVIWRRRLLSSRGFSISNVKRADIPKTMDEIETIFSQEICRYGIYLSHLPKE